MGCTFIRRKYGRYAGAASAIVLVLLLTSASKVMAGDMERFKKVKKAWNPTLYKKAAGTETGTIESLGKLNVLKTIIFDPKTGNVSLLGYYDPAYAVKTIPYKTLLSEAVKYPFPRFSLDHVKETEKYSDEIVERYKRDEALCQAHPERNNDGATKIAQILLNDPDLAEYRLRYFKQRAERLNIPTEEFIKSWGYVHTGKGLEKSDKAGLMSDNERIRQLGKIIKGMGHEDLGEAYLYMASEDPSKHACAFGAIGADMQLLELTTLLKDGRITEERASLEGIILIVDKTLEVAKMPEAERNALFDDVRKGRKTREYLLNFNTEKLMGYIKMWFGDMFTDFIIPDQIIKKVYPGKRGEIELKYTGLDPNTELGRILFRADYDMKFSNIEEDTSVIKDYKSEDYFLSKNGAFDSKHPLMLLSSVVEFTLVPREVKLKVSADNRVISFDRANVAVETYLKSASGLPEENIRRFRTGVEEYGRYLTESYEEYCKVRPSWHELREALKIIAFARWLNKNGYKVTLKDAVPSAWRSPGRVEDVIRIRYYKRGESYATNRSTFGGVDFTEEKSGSTMSIESNDVMVEKSATDQLAYSAFFGQEAAEAAQAGDLEDAHALAEKSAQAMTGQIDLSELPDLAMPPIPLTTAGAPPGEGLEAAASATTAPTPEQAELCSQLSAMTARGIMDCESSDQGSQDSGQRRLEEAEAIYQKIQDYPSSARTLLEQLQAGETRTTYHGALSEPPPVPVDGSGEAEVLKNMFPEEKKWYDGLDAATADPEVAALIKNAQELRAQQYEIKKLLRRMSWNARENNLDLAEWRKKSEEVGGKARDLSYSLSRDVLLFYTGKFFKRWKVAVDKDLSKIVDDEKALTALATRDDIRKIVALKRKGQFIDKLEEQFTALQILISGMDIKNSYMSDKDTMDEKVRDIMTSVIAIDESIGELIKDPVGYEIFGEKISDFLTFSTHVTNSAYLAAEQYTEIGQIEHSGEYNQGYLNLVKASSIKMKKITDDLRAIETRLKAKIKGRGHNR